MPILIQPDELAARIADPALAARTVVLDVRWSLAAPDGRDAFRSGHVPGAVYVDLETKLSDPVRAATPADGGRHPLPDEAALTASLRRWGVHDGDTVVVTDDAKNLAAARAWWLLRYAGLADVRLLDGALAGWRAAGHPLETGGTAARPAGDVTAHYGALPVIDADAAAALPGAGGVLLDARAGERYRGETEPIDPVAGHIPGAVSAPSTDVVGDDGRFLDAETLRARFAALGVRPDAEVAVYCGSGVTAAHTAAALAIAGVDAAVYPGSWSEWSNRGLPVETATPPAVVE